jgi:hypothetical protein
MEFRILTADLFFSGTWSIGDPWGTNKNIHFSSNQPVPNIFLLCGAPPRFRRFQGRDSKFGNRRDVQRSISEDHGKGNLKRDVGHVSITQPTFSF